MAEKGTKKKKAKADAGVLGALPSTRPNRLGRHAAKATPRPVAKKKAAPKRKAKPRPKVAAAGKPAATAVPISEAAPRRPKPVRSASKNLAAPAKQAAAKRAPAPSKQPSGTELVTTVVQAAGELAQVGLSIGGQIVKRAVERLPKP